MNVAETEEVKRCKISGKVTEMKTDYGFKGIKCGKL